MRGLLTQQGCLEKGLRLGGGGVYANHASHECLYKQQRNYGHNKGTTTPETTKKMSSDNNTRMVVLLAYTHAQDSLGNVITRTTIVISQQEALAKK